MEYLWVLFVIIYASLKSSRDCMKKAAVKRSPIFEVLFLYTSIGFLLTLPYLSQALQLEIKYIFLVFIKSVVICLAWFFSFFALGKMPVSLYCIVDLSGVVFSMLMGVLVLGESMTVYKALGAFLVIVGLVLVNMKKSSSVKEASFPIILCALICCLLNSVSGTMDKALTKYMTPNQLQFWFMLFISVLYGLVLVIRREKATLSTLKSNFWIPLMSVSLVVGDKFLFEANATEASSVTVMTVIKQSAVIVTVLLGWLIYKEKNIPYKLFCCLIVLSGILVSVFCKG